MDVTRVVGVRADPSECCDILFGGNPFGKGGSAFMNVPYGTRYLLLTCADPADLQFRGIASACGLLARSDGVHHLVWDGQGESLEALRNERVGGGAK